MSNPDPRSKITIEDLLRLKKSERPAAEFWVGFEHELRQKQLSALVEKRSSWRDLPRFFARRAYLPIGATAILAFTLISIKNYGLLPVSQHDGVSVIPATAAPVILAESPESVSTPASVSSPLVNRSVQPTPLAIERPAALTGDHSPAEVAQTSSTVKSPLVEDSPSARSIAANFARLEQSEPELINAVLGSRLSSSARIQNSTTPVPELASLQLNGTKRTRLLAHYNDRQTTVNPVAAEATRERLSRRLGDSDFNDSFTRIGLKGDQVSLKF